MSTDNKLSIRRSTMAIAPSKVISHNTGKNRHINATTVIKPTIENKVKNINTSKSAS